MVNEPLVHQPPPSEQPASPSLAELLAARPRTGTGSAISATAPQPITLPDEPAMSSPMPSPSPSPRAFPSRLVSVPDAGFTSSLEQEATDANVKVPLLLVHSGHSEGALVQSWMRNVLKGNQPHSARFQEAVADIVQYQQPHGVLIQFDPGCVDAAVALATHLKMHHPQVPRLAIGRTRDAPCMLAALRSGVQDFFDLDAPIEIAQQTVLQLISRPPSVAPGVSRAPQTAILSARAGLGCSLLAAHLSWYLQTRLAQAVVPSSAIASDASLAGHGSGAESLVNLLIDLGTPGGDCAIYLNTPGEFSFSDAVTQQLRLDRRMAQTALPRHESGLRLLAQPRQSYPSASTEVDALLKRLSQYFRHIVFDLGAIGSPQLTQGILPHASEIWVVCDQSVASVVWTAELLEQIGQIQVARDRIQLIVSRHDPRLELSAQQIARQLKLPLLAVIPECRRELSEVVNQGMLLAPGGKRTPYAQAIEQLAGHLILAHHPGLAASQPSSSKSFTGPISGPIARLLQRIRGH